MKRLICNDKDLKQTREELLKLQQGKDLITKETVRNPCLDHDHGINQQVRGVIGREVNVFLGKVENGYYRYIGYWSDIPLPDLLENMAEYIRRPNEEIVHKGWIDVSVRKFKSLAAVRQKYLLKIINSNNIGGNQDTRVKSLRKVLVSGSISYGEFFEYFDYVKEKPM